MMLRQLDANVRKSLVDARCSAMLGNMDDAKARLDAAVGTSKHLPPVNTVALLMLKAELLFLSYGFSAARTVFREEIDPLAHTLPYEVNLTIADNRNLVAMADFDPRSVREHYLLFDRERMAGIEDRDSIAILGAEVAADAGRHYDALPKYWHTLLYAYLGGNWQATQWAARWIARECVRLGWPAQAAHYALLSCEDHMGRMVGRTLLSMRKTELVVDTLNRLCDTAHLPAHATVGCALLREIGDAVPTSYVEKVLKWIVPFCGRAPKGIADANLATNSWKALAAIVPQLNATQASAVIKMAVSHDAWRNACPLREHLIHAVNGCVAALPPSALSELVAATLAVVTEHKHDMDYVDAINLVCHVASRSEGNEIKAQFATALYPPGQKVGAALVQVASVFGRTIEDKDAMQTWARQIADELRLHVQRLAPGTEPKTNVSGYIGNVTNDAPTGKTVVLFGYGLALSTLAVHRKMLAPEPLRLLVDAMLDMIQEPDNILSNKGTLVNTLSLFADSLSPEQASRALDLLYPIAKGEIVESKVGMNEDDANNPLNRFQMRMGNKAVLRGLALVTLVDIDEVHHCFGEKLTPILEAAILNSNAEVRAYGLRAAQGKSNLSGPALMALVLSTRDGDPDVASAAFEAVATAKVLTLDSTSWHLLVTSLTYASSSAHVKLRRAAAYATSRLLGRTADPQLAADLERLRKAYSDDICYSVRRRAGAV